MKQLFESTGRRTFEEEIKFINYINFQVKQAHENKTSKDDKRTSDFFLQKAIDYGAKYVKQSTHRSDSSRTGSQSESGSCSDESSFTIESDKTLCKSISPEKTSRHGEMKSVKSVEVKWTG